MRRVFFAFERKRADRRGAKKSASGWQKALDLREAISRGLKTCAGGDARFAFGLREGLRAPKEGRAPRGVAPAKGVRLAGGKVSNLAWFFENRVKEGLVLAFGVVVGGVWAGREEIQARQDKTETARSFPRRSTPAVVASRCSKSKSKRGGAS